MALYQQFKRDCLESFFARYFELVRFGFFFGFRCFRFSSEVCGVYLLIRDADKFREKENGAALKIQRLWRGSRARKYIAFLRFFVAFFPCWLSSSLTSFLRLCCAVRSAAITIQRVYKGFRARSEYVPCYHFGCLSFH
jgi:hypothetical protein